MPGCSVPPTDSSPKPPDAEKTPLLANVSRSALTIVALIALCRTVTAAAGEDPDAVGSKRPSVSVEALPEAAIVGRVILDKQNVFDLADPRENNWLYALANRWHVVTRDRLIRRQLLFAEGDAFSPRLLEESERILRQNRFLFDARVRPVAVNGKRVAVEVATRDTWTLVPDLSFSRAGGENRVKYGIEDSNLLGRGQLLRIARIDDVDRSSNRIEFADRNITRNRWSLYARLADNSDGRAHALAFTRPFLALDTRWSAGVNVRDETRNEPLYRLGKQAAAYRRERDYASAFAGWSGGLRGRWTRRFTVGVVYDDNRFGAVPGTRLETRVPAGRKLVYPYVGIELIEDRFATGNNRNQIGRTEDFFFGTRLAASLGWAGSGLGSDRDAAIFTASAGKGFGRLEGTALFVEIAVSGRHESGRAVNTLARFDARYYWHWADKRTFFVTLSAAAGDRLDLDNPVQLGGATGLRGYPLRYQSGDTKLLFTVEQRFFTDWYPWRLVRIGGAVFADAGRTWGRNPVGEAQLGWLRNAGLGLRLAPTRASSDKMIHVDLAFPLDGDPSIDDVQFLLEIKRSF